jgi:Polyketide cyclase / dehydrase and lipid transport
MLRHSRDEEAVEVVAEGLVDASAETAFAFLANLDNHWLLSDRFIELASLDAREGFPRGGTVRLNGPLLLHRTVRTRVVGVSRPDELVGSAEVGRRTRAVVRWSLAPRGTRTAVRLSATVWTLGLPDRLLLAAGGKRWLRRRFAATIASLAWQLAQQALLPAAYPESTPDGRRQVTGRVAA